MTNLSRRKLIQTSILGSIGLLVSKPVFSKTKKDETQFEYCLNTSTISGQNPGLLNYLKIASKAGYNSIEVWIRDIKEYIAQGHSISSLQSAISDSGLKVANAIGFAPWMVNDDSNRKAGFEQMKEEMELLAEIGCKRIAAPAAGVNNELDLFKVAERFKFLLDLGRETGVMPLLEFWGASKYFYNLGQALMVAATANDPDARILADVYHLFRGGSGFDGLKLISGNALEVFHMNDYPGNIPREQQKDSDRIFPGDGVAPLKQILKDLSNMGGKKVLSLELFNKTYWEQDALEVAIIGLDKMKEQVHQVI